MKIGERIRGFFKRDFGVSQDDDLTILIKQLSETQLTREQVLGIPAVNGCIEYIAGKIAPLPIKLYNCLLYTSPSPRDSGISRMPSSA